MAPLQSAFNDFIHLFFPHLCTGCGSDILTLDHQLCLHCIAELPNTNFFEHPDNPVEKKFYGRLEVAQCCIRLFLIQKLVDGNLDL